MNPIEKAIAEVKFAIPAEILHAAFIKREFGRVARATNIDTLIRERVIEARVLPDCDLTGGEQTLIPLDGLVGDYVDYSTVVYRIPKDRTQNRSITRVLSIGMGAGYGNTGNPVATYLGGSQMQGAAQGVMQAQMDIPVVSTANLKLVAENTIMIFDQPQLPASMYLRCYLENDRQMSQLPPTAYHKFCRLVELATKAYIRNQLVIAMGEAHLSGGMELGGFREIVDSYADANELYQTYLEETWRKVAFLADPLTKMRHVRQTAGGRW